MAHNTSGNWSWVSVGLPHAPILVPLFLAEKMMICELQLEQSGGV
jgi:hypothetical protein